MRSRTTGPVFLIENKLMYGRPNRRPEDGHVGEPAVRETGDRYPALTFSGADFTEARDDRDLRGMVPVVLDAVTELILEHEIFCEMVALSQLLPLELEPVLESVARTGAPRHRRGNAHGRLRRGDRRAHAEARLERLECPRASRCGATDYPWRGRLEDAMLPSAHDVVDAIAALEGVRS